MDGNPNSEDVVNKFRSDGILNPFLDDNFDVQSYTTEVIQSAAISQRLAQLVDGISILDKELQSQIATRHEDLLAQATGIESLEGVLNMMQTRILSLQSAVDRIRGKVVEPYNKIRTRTLQLGRLQAACDLLRRIIRILYLSKRLQAQLQGGIREITKAAQSLNELDYLSQGVDLTGVDIISGDLLFAKRARNEIESQTSRLLEQGVLAQNPSQIATALQAFYNLGDLYNPLRKTTDDLISSLQSQIRRALDPKIISNAVNNISTKTSGSNLSHSKGPGKAAGMPTPGDTPAFRTLLWNNMEEVMENVHLASTQIINLQKVLSKKRDPVTHHRFIDELSKEGKSTQFARLFWQNMSRCIDEELKHAVKSSSFIQQAFEGEYPKLMRLYNNLWCKVLPFCEALEGKVEAFKDATSFAPQDIEIPSDTSSKPKETNFNPELALKQSLRSFETAYLQRSLSRLFDPVNLVFPPGAKNPPSDEEVDAIIKTISSEISVSSVDAGLSITVARNVAKTVKFFAVKSEQLLSTQGEASQVIGPPNLNQRCNANVINSLYRLQKSLSKVFAEHPDYSPEAIEIVQESLVVLTILMSNGIRPLLSSMADSVEAIILTIHNEDFSRGNPEPGENVLCSLYMKELQDFISRVVKDHLALFKCKDFVIESLIPLGQRALTLFVRHATLVRPLGEGGKVILAADFAQMELAVTPLCRRMSELGAPYRILRAFRPLLFVTDAGISESPSVGEVIPYSTVIHYLFSRAPDEFRSSHKVMDWSLSRYSKWMDEHKTEKERLNMLRGTIEHYVNSVKSRQGTEFAAIYPIMLGLLQKGMEKNS
ncbi:conserved oligomeric Golgi complex subunit 5-like [Styela clava]